MNKINQLFSADYVRELFKEKLLSLYPQYQDVEGVSIRPYKKMIWTNTYHVVVSYKVKFIKFDSSQEEVFVVCSAHSSEPRENVYQSMQYLWQNDFNSGQIDIPRPLFYSQEFRGTFYQGLNGENLFHYIKSKENSELEKMLPLVASMFARLHKLPAGEQANFNSKNAYIKTVLPGADTIIREMSERYEGKFKADVSHIYEKMIAKEAEYLSQIQKCLIHGDAHTENIIKTGDDRIGLIDFTDFCLSDFARDIGTFMQQLEYKLIARQGDADYAFKMKQLFLDSYLEASGQEKSNFLMERIKLYYDWTSMRTAIYLFLKHDSDPIGAEILLNKVKNDLNI